MSPAAEDVATVDHVFAPVLRGDEVVAASSAIGCVGVVGGDVMWREPIRAGAGPFAYGHRSIAGPRCPALVCRSPHPGEPGPSAEIDPLIRRARAQGIEAIAVLDRAGPVAALRGDATLRNDLLVRFDPVWVWRIPPPQGGAPRAEPMALASDPRRAVLFWDGRHLAAFPLR